jgi:hypothetical protein
MRQLQKKGDLKNKPELFFRLKKIEGEVDDVCDKKIAEWNRKEDLFENAGAYAPA